MTTRAIAARFRAIATRALDALPQDAAGLSQMALAMQSRYEQLVVALDNAEAARDRVEAWPPQPETEEPPPAEPTPPRQRRGERKATRPSENK